MDSPEEAIRALEQLRANVDRTFREFQETGDDVKTKRAQQTFIMKSRAIQKFYEQPRLYRKVARLRALTITRHEV